ncbi:MAG TPA: nucleotidyltransferase family protein [Fodinibius sp.]|nr:nucleotidyltransferase family protein [Fodinibius sp.]
MTKLDDIRQKVQPILEKYGIKKAGVFGSAARGEAETNDVDLLVKIERKISLLDFIGIQQELEDELDMKVDLVEYDSLKPALREDILKEEVPVI